jgi:Ca2+:H+ antiporter
LPQGNSLKHQRFIGEDEGMSKKASSASWLDGIGYLVLPVAAFILMLVTWDQKMVWQVLVALGLLLVATVYAAVHHAEVVALRVGEPYGAFILAVAVTVIEVGMIVVLILDSPGTSENLARDTVFAAVMITTNGIVGTALLIKTLNYRIATFNPQGITGALAILGAIAMLSLVLPGVTVSSPGLTFTNFQLAVAAVVSLALYLVFVFAKTVRHRDFFLPKPKKNQVPSLAVHVPKPSAKVARLSLGLLFVALIAVVGLAKTTSPLILQAVEVANLPTSVVGVSIAVVVLAPEWISAIRAARFGRIQKSFNLAYGSALASIGLTIPVMAIISIFFGYQINLGLRDVETYLLILTLIASALTVLPGKANLMQAAVHLGIFGTWLLVVIAP